MTDISIFSAHLAKDEKLRPLVEQITPRVITHKTNVCLSLCSSILSQQLSTKVAEVIFRRFLELFPGGEPGPEQILAVAPETLRAIGLSNAKVSYVQNVARYFLEHTITDASFAEKTNEEIIELLSPIKGVGRWTIEMLLMFTLGREDVFAVDDLGIKQGMVKIYGLDETDKKALRNKMLEISGAWAPYRTFACLYIWDYKDNK